MSENGLAIAQAFEAASTDYNHLIVDGNNLLLAGSNKGGAILGQATLTSGAIGDKINLYSMTSSTKGDANCVAKYGNSYVVATTQGFSVFDQSFNNVNYAGTEGKYVVTSGSDLYTLALTNSLNKYTSADLSSAAASWNTTSAITPKDNKSVMAIDGTTMYVCKGENGIDKVDLSTGTVSQFWTCPKFIASTSSSLETGAEYTKGNCNGIAVKGDFIYVAHGTYGLVVLDKQGNMVCHRKAYTGKSANFVAVDDNYIYVAYGQSRVQVFKLTGTTKLTTD